MRVLAFQSKIDDVVNVYGEGTMIGSFIPNEGFLSELNIPNPCILLDDGRYAFGYACWWGDLEKAKAKFINCSFNTVNDNNAAPKYEDDYILSESKVTDSPLIEQITLKQIKAPNFSDFVLELKFGEGIKEARLVMIDECICRIDYKIHGENSALCYSAFCKELKNHPFLQNSIWSASKSFIAKNTQIYMFNLELGSKA